MCARENLKPVTRAKQFTCFNIFSMHDQNDFSVLEVISLIQAVAF